MRPALFLWISVAWCVHLTEQTQPGLKLRLSQAGLNYAAKVAIDDMTGDVQGQKIPDQHGSAHVSIGKVDYDLTEMSVTSFGKPSSSIVVHPGSDMTWSLSNLALSVHGDWHYKYKYHFIHKSDHGSFDVSVSGASLSVSVAMGVDSTGHPTVSSKACTCNAGSVHVKFHGGASWLYNLFDHDVAKSLKGHLQSLLCSAVNKAINVKAAQQLAKLKVQIPIEGMAMLDYRLVAAPELGSSFVETLHKGEFFWNGDTTEAPFQPTSLPEPPSTSRMVTIWLSEYPINTLGYILQRHGILKYNLSKKDLPPKYASALNVTCTSGMCIGSLLPKLKQLYPDAVVELNLQSTEAPQIQMNPSGINGLFRGLIIYNVRLNNGSLKHAFSTKMSSKMSLTVNMENNKITATVKAITNNITVTNSSIGPVYATVLEILFKVMADGFIIPKLNDFGQKGLVVPSIDHVDYVNSQLQILQHAISLQTDVKYTPGDTLYFSPRTVEH